MSRPIPALDPLASRAESTGFIRTESIRLPPSDRRTPPSGCSGEKEEPGVTLWAGPKVLFINAVFPGIDLNDLQIRITGTRLVFSGPLASDAAIEKTRTAPRAADSASSVIPWSCPTRSMPIGPRCAKKTD